MTKEHVSQFDHNETREELESIRASGLVDAPACFDPRGEKQRPAFERTSYQARPCSFAEIMELFAVHERGPLARPLQRPVKGEAYGEDDARRAHEWVENTPGWSPVVHEVMKHLEVRQLTWDQWPRAHVEKPTFCPWPPCGVPLETAQTAWLPFFRALRKRYREDPFVVRVQTVELS